MQQELILATPLAPQPIGHISIPALFADAGETVTQRFLEFFTAEHRHANTRAAYAQAVSQFTDWAGRQGIRLDDLTPVHIAGYIEQLGYERAAPTVKQHL